jgi:hypothetical protein
MVSLSRHRCADILQDDDNATEAQVHTLSNSVPTFNPTKVCNLKIYIEVCYCSS